MLCPSMEPVDQLADKLPHTLSILLIPGLPENFAISWLWWPMCPLPPVALVCGRTLCLILSCDDAPRNHSKARMRSSRGWKSRPNIHLNKDCHCFGTHTSSSLIQVCLGYPGGGKSKSEENKNNHLMLLRETGNRGDTVDCTPACPHCLDMYQCFLNEKITRGDIRLLGLCSNHLVHMDLPLSSFTQLWDHNEKWPFYWMLGVGNIS